MRTPHVLEEPWTLKKALAQPDAIITPSTVKNHLRLLQDHKQLASHNFEVEGVDAKDVLTLLSYAPPTASSQELKTISLSSDLASRPTYLNVQHAPLGFAVKFCKLAQLENADKQVYFNILSCLHQLNALMIHTGSSEKDTSELGHLQRLPNLSHFIFKSPWIDLMSLVVCCTQILKTLNISCAPSSIEHQHFQLFTRCKRLKVLEIINGRNLITDEELLNWLKSMPSIAKLRLHKCANISGSIFETIHLVAPQLEHLEIKRAADNCVPQHPEVYIRGLMPRLHTLDLYVAWHISPKMGDSFKLNYLPNLGCFKLNSRNIELKTLQVEHCSKLQQFEIDSFTTPEVIEKLSQKKTMRTITVWDSLDLFLQYKWESLTDITISDKRLLQDTVAKSLLKACPSLTSIKLHVKPKDMRPWEEVFDDLTNWPCLRMLYIYGAVKVMNRMQAVKHLKKRALGRGASST